MIPIFLTLRFLYFLFYTITATQGVLVNVTVDDSLPDPDTGETITYLPEDQWKAGVECSECTAAIDRQFMNDRTWHDGSYFHDTSGGPLNVTFKFNGTAIYVFCALALSTSLPDGYTNMSFYIDGEFVHQFERKPPGIRGSYQYNVSVYSNSSLTSGEHTFMLQNGQHGNVGNNSLTLFDYLVYSKDDGKETSAPSQSRSHKPVGIIVGVTIGSVSAIAVLGLLAWFFRQRKHRTAYSQSFNIETAYDDNVVPDPFITRSEMTLPLMEQSESFIPVSSNPGVVTQQREFDAGPIEIPNRDHDEGFLPPNYGEVFLCSDGDLEESQDRPVPPAPHRKSPVS